MSSQPRGSESPIHRPSETRKPFRMNRRTVYEKVSATSLSASLVGADCAVRPVYERVVERQRLQEKQEQEQVEIFALSERHRSRTSSILDERSTMANRKLEPFVLLSALERMRLVFELHEWRTQRKRQTLLCFMSPHGNGEDMTGSGEEDITAMLQSKQKQQEMEMRLRNGREEGGNHLQSASHADLSSATAPSPGIPFNVFEREIVEPFFDAFFPPCAVMESKRFSQFSYFDNANLSQGLMTQPTVNGSSPSRNVTASLRNSYLQKSSYQRHRASHVEAAENLFRLIDANVDGFVSWNELSSYILQAGQHHLVEDHSLQCLTASSQKPIAGGGGGGAEGAGENSTGGGGDEVGIDGGGVVSARMLAFAPLPTNTSVWQKQYPLVRFLNHSQPIRKILTSSRSRRYVTVAWDGLVKLWRHDPCLSDARGKPAIVHERNLFATSAPIIDAVLSPESFGDSEMAAVVAIDGTVTLLRVGTGEVLKTFVGRCCMPPSSAVRCVSSSKERRRLWQKEGIIGDTIVSKDVRSSLDSATTVLRPTFKVRAYHREAIDIFFTDVSRYFSGLGVVAPTYEHLERRRAVKADVLKGFGVSSGSLGEWYCGEKNYDGTQEHFNAPVDRPSPSRSADNARSTRCNSPTSSGSSSGSDNSPCRDEDSEDDNSDICHIRDSHVISSSGGRRGTTRGNENDIRSASTTNRHNTSARSGGTEINSKNFAFNQSHFQQSCEENNDEKHKNISQRHPKSNRQLESETSWFARSVAFARHELTCSTSQLPAGAYLLLGFETGVLQLYRMRPQWFTISNLCATRVEPQAMHAPALTILLHRAAITHIIFNEPSGLIMTGSDDATVVVRHISRIHIPFVTLGAGLPRPGMIPSHNHGHTRRITCMSYNAARGILVTGGNDRYIFPWLPSSARPIQSIDLRDYSSNKSRHSGHPIDISFMQPPRQSLLLLVLDSKRTIFLFDAITFSCVHIMCDDSPGSLCGGPLLRVCYDAADNRLVLAGKCLRTWDTARDDRYPYDYIGHRRPLVGLAFQRHWRFWVSADDAIVIVWRGEVVASPARARAASFSTRSAVSATGRELTMSPLRSWRVKGGICSMSVDQTESAHVFVALLRGRRIVEYNIFTGSVLRTFDFPANVGEITSLACSAAALGAPPPAMYQHASPLSFMCGTFERDQTQDGTTALYSLAVDSGSIGNGVHRRIVTSGVGVSSAVIIASLGLVVVGHRGGISTTPFDETTTCPIACLRLTDKPPKDKHATVVCQKTTTTTAATTNNNSINNKAHSVRLPSSGTSSTLDSQPYNTLRDSSAELSHDTGGHCRQNPSLDLAALFPGPLVHDPVAITRECMLHRERYLFHDEKASGTAAAALSRDADNHIVDGENHNNNNLSKIMSYDPNIDSLSTAPPLLLFSEEFTAKASMVGSSFGVFVREQLSSLGFVLHIAPVADTGYIATGSDDGLVQFWNLRTVTEVMRFRATYTMDTVTAIDVCPAAAYTAVGDASGYVLLLHIGRVAWNCERPLEMVKDIESGVRVRHRWRGHQQGVTSVRFVHSPPQQSGPQSTRVSHTQMQRPKNFSTVSSSLTTAATTVMTAVRSRAVRGGSQAVPTIPKPVVDEMAPVLLCTSGEDTYIYAWCWQQKRQGQQTIDMDGGELHCIGCFGGGVEMPPVPPLGKWTESAWRVLDAVRRLYVSERLMSPGGLLGAAGFTISVRDQPSPAILERAAAFVMEDMRTVRATGASLPQVARPISGRQHGGDASRHLLHSVIRYASKRTVSMFPPCELAPTFVFAFEEGTYYDRNLVELIARTVAEITGCKVMRPEPPEETTESTGKNNTEATATALTPMEGNGSPMIGQEHKTSQAPMQMQEQGFRDGQVPSHAPESTALPLSELPVPNANLVTTVAVEHSNSSLPLRASRTLSAITLPHNLNYLNESAEVVLDELTSGRTDVVLRGQPPALQVSALQKDVNDSGRSQLSMALPSIRRSPANLSQRPLSVNSFSPIRGGSSQARLITWDQVPPVAVAYETATPLPRMRQPNLMEQGIAGADALLHSKRRHEERLPLFSHIMPRPGSPKSRVTGPVEKVLIKEKPRKSVFRSKLFVNYIDVPTNQLEAAVGSEERAQARRENKRMAMLWGPARVMGTLMSWKAPIVEPSSTAGLRGRRARDHSAFCDTDEQEISLPLCMPLGLGCDNMVSRPGSEPLVERCTSVLILEAEVDKMKDILQAAMLEKQQLMAQERAIGQSIPQ